MLKTVSQTIFPMQFSHFDNFKEKRNWKDIFTSPFRFQFVHFVEIVNVIFIASTLVIGKSVVKAAEWVKSRRQKKYFHKIAVNKCPPQSHSKNPETCSTFVISEGTQTYLKKSYELKYYIKFTLYFGWFQVDQHQHITTFTVRRALCISFKLWRIFSLFSEPEFPVCIT